MRQVTRCVLGVLLGGLLAVGCSSADSPAPHQAEPPSADAAISSFEQCAAAGNAVTRMLPPSCRTKDGRIFIKGRAGEVTSGTVNKTDDLPHLGLEGSSVGILKPEPQGVPHADGRGCRDACGDGECQEIVCMAVGCPCPESKVSCPKDCSAP